MSVEGFTSPTKPDPGNFDWVTIQTNDGKKIYGLEFLYGNGWTTGDIWGAYPWGNSAAYLEWKTLVGGTVVSSGQVGIAEFLHGGIGHRIQGPRRLRSTDGASPSPEPDRSQICRNWPSTTCTWTSLGRHVPSCSRFLPGNYANPGDHVSPFRSWGWVGE